MGESTLFGWDVSQYLTLAKLATLTRFGILLFVGIPLVYFFSNWVRRNFSKKYSAQQGMIAGKIILYSGIFAVGFAILNELGFKLTHLLGAAGIVGIALGFASQTSVSNVISGIFLMAERPFVVNDVITIGGTTGQVLSIDTLSIKLRTFDNKFVRIPNENIIKSEVTNVTYFPIRRVDIPVGMAYKEDVGRVRELLLDIAYKNPLCLKEPQPLVIFSGFGNSSIDLMFAVWAAKADFLKVKNAIQEEIKNRFDEEGIEIPFPHLSLYRGEATRPFPVEIVASGTGGSKDS